MIGQISNLAATGPIRQGRLVPLLLEHVSDHIGLHLHYGNRTAQPRRVRAFIDLAIQRLADRPDYLLSEQELGDRRWAAGADLLAPQSRTPA